VCLQALLSAHDTVAQKDYEPVLPPMPDDEEEEATRTVCLVKNKQPLVRRSAFRGVEHQNPEPGGVTEPRPTCGRDLRPFASISVKTGVEEVL